MTLLGRVVAILDGASIPHCLIGATAAALHGVVRGTVDVDLLIADARGLRSDTWAPLGSEPEVRIFRGDIEDSLQGTVRITTQGDESPVDVVVAGRKWMSDILARSKRVEALGTMLGQPELADLVLLKLDAGSVRDLADVREMIDSALDPALVSTVESRLQALSPRHRRRWERLRSGR